MNYANGTNHPDDLLPLVPPSYDESIIYNNQHVQMFLRTPDHKPKHLKNGDTFKLCFWKSFNRRNRCSAQQSAKMFCVLLAQKSSRENLLQCIEENYQLWNDNTLTDQQKVMKLINKYKETT